MMQTDVHNRFHSFRKIFVTYTTFLYGSLTHLKPLFGQSSVELSHNVKFFASHSKSIRTPLYLVTLYMNVISERVSVHKTVICICALSTIAKPLLAAPYTILHSPTQDSVFTARDFQVMPATKRGVQPVISVQKARQTSGQTSKKRSQTARPDNRLGTSALGSTQG